MVPTTSPANLAAVRTTPGAGWAGQPVSMQYVNAEFATKSYVDQSVANVGSGNFLPTAGGSMTGPITLPGNPAAPMQAATKQYVDGTVQCLNASTWAKPQSQPSLPRFNPSHREALSKPTSSLQFSSVFFTSAMNWSATAPSMMR